jgi:hypothetical protein
MCKVVVLGIIADRSTTLSHVPEAVYITIIAVQLVGVLYVGLISSPSSIRRNDGRPIAIFKSLGWFEELVALLKNVTTPKLLLLAPGFVASNIPTSFSGSLNSFYYDARTRALLNVNNPFS